MILWGILLGVAEFTARLGADPPPNCCAQVGQARFNVAGPQPPGVCISGMIDSATLYLATFPRFQFFQTIFIVPEL